MVALDKRMMSLVDPVVAARARDNVIIPLFSNRGFLPYVKNLLCSVDRVSVDNWMVLALDNATCAPIAAGFGLVNQQPNSGQPCVYPYSHRPLTKSHVSKYRSKEFNRMVMQRPMWVRHLLRSGYSVLQCDLDIAWLKSPFELFKASTLFANADLLLQSESGHGHNAGFYFARPTVATDVFMTRWIDDLIKLWGQRAFEEQHSLGRALRQTKQNHSLGKLKVHLLCTLANLHTAGAHLLPPTLRAS